MVDCVPIRVILLLHMWYENIFQQKCAFVYSFCCLFNQADLSILVAPFLYHYNENILSNTIVLVENGGQMSKSLMTGCLNGSIIHFLILICFKLIQIGGIETNVADGRT